jgi:hypothetical protein
LAGRGLDDRGFDDRREIRGEAGAAQGAVQRCGFPGEIGAVAEMLDGAATAGAEMRADRVDTVW